MEIIFTEHAKDRMQQRTIHETVVVGVIESPGRLGRGFRDRELARGTLNDRTIEVVFVRERESIVVVTVYWIEEE